LEKIEKRLTDLSGALAHKYPEIKLTKSYKPAQMAFFRYQNSFTWEKVGIR